MIKCREVPEALQDPQASLKIRLQLRWHLLICPPCRALQRQWQQLDSSLKRWLQDSPADHQELVRKISEKYLK